MFALKKILDMSNGSSTGVRGFDNVKHQQRKLRSLLQAYYGDFRSNNMEPTPEQISLKKKKDARLAAIEARKQERLHRGGYYKTKVGKARGGLTD